MDFDKMDIPMPSEIIKASINIHGELHLNKESTQALIRMFEILEQGVDQLTEQVGGLKLLIKRDAV